MRAPMHIGGGYSAPLYDHLNHAATFGVRQCGGVPVHCLVDPMGRRSSIEFRVQLDPGMRSFTIPTHYRSDLIGRLKAFRKAQDPKKKDLSPTLLDLGSVRFVFARHFGFCYGVENAIEISYKAWRRTLVNGSSC